jgi:hypothetical protein
MISFSSNAFAEIIIMNASARHTVDETISPQIGCTDVVCTDMGMISWITAVSRNFVNIARAQKLIPHSLQEAVGEVQTSHSKPDHLQAGAGSEDMDG